MAKDEVRRCLCQSAMEHPCSIFLPIEKDLPLLAFDNFWLLCLILTCGWIRTHDHEQFQIRETGKKKGNSDHLVQNPKRYLLYYFH